MYVGTVLQRDDVCVALDVLSLNEKVKCIKQTQIQFICLLSISVNLTTRLKVNFSKGACVRTFQDQIT